MNGTEDSDAWTFVTVQAVKLKIVIACVRSKHKGIEFSEAALAQNVLNSSHHLPTHSKRDKNMNKPQTNITPTQSEL